MTWWPFIVVLSVSTPIFVWVGLAYAIVALCSCN